MQAVYWLTSRIVSASAIFLPVLYVLGSNFAEVDFTFHFFFGVNKIKASVDH